MDILNAKHFEFLKSVSIFKNLTEAELQHIIKQIQTREVPENELVFARLEREEILYIVRYGKLKLELAGNDDKYFEKGDVFGELAVINNNLRTGTIKAIEPSLLFSLNGKDLLNESIIPSTISIKIFIELAKMISSYLTNAQNTSTYSLIEQGENDFVEFKSTLRWNLYTKKFDKEIENAALKTIAAFLNSSGGTLIVGVDDKKEILGLASDKFKDDDHCLLHLTKLIQDRVSMQHTQFVTANIEQSNGIKILRVDIKLANEPAYVIHNNEETFYIRSGPSTAQLRVSEIYDFIHSRFYKSG
ncbi:MAG: putative DNA binding domain-containing protein [Bacteroidales bacterium]|nr:putative DNA binding domain-containing protein [Bacteroidales bacterium]